MEGSKLDLRLMFQDDPELLALLEDTPVSVVQGPADTLPESVPVIPDMPVMPEMPVIPVIPEISDMPAESFDGPPVVKTAPAAVEETPPAVAEAAPAAVPSADEFSLDLAMAELDQLLAGVDLSELDFLPPDFEPPPQPAPAQPAPDRADSLLTQDLYIPADPLARTDPEDEGDPLVFEKATPFEPFGEKDLSDQTISGQPFPSPPEVPAAEAQPAAPPKTESLPDLAGREPVKIPPSRSKRITGIVFNVLFFLLCFSLVAGSAVFAFSNDSNKSFLGFRFFNVESTSMKPQPGGPSGGFDTGDIVVVKRVDALTIDVGDIITFRTGESNSVYNTHRVREIRPQADDQAGPFFITRGDANPVDDQAPVSSEMMVGKVVLVLPKMGAVLKYVRENLILFIVFLIALFSFGFLLRGLLFNRIQAKQKSTPETTQSQIRDGSRE